MSHRRLCPTLLSIVAVSLALQGCAQHRRPRPAGDGHPPPATRPVYRLQVADADEAELLRQQMKLDIRAVEGQDVYFNADEPALTKLKALDYVITPVDARQVMHQVVRVARRGDEAKLVATGVRLINREKSHWIVRGSLRQLELLRASGYDVRPLDGEVRPRQVRIIVNAPADVQRVNEMHVDIYSATRTRDGKIVIDGAAFDAEIDAVRRANYDITVLPPPP